LTLVRTAVRELANDALRVFVDSLGMSIARETVSLRSVEGGTDDTVDCRSYANLGLELRPKALGDEARADDRGVGSTDDEAELDDDDDDDDDIIDFLDSRLATAGATDCSADEETEDEVLE